MVEPAETDSTPDMFPEYPQPPGTFLLGMKLEVSHFFVMLLLFEIRFFYVV
jgi:hypothetical protein